MEYDYTLTSFQMSCTKGREGRVFKPFIGNVAWNLSLMSQRMHRPNDAGIADNFEHHSLVNPLRNVTVVFLASKQTIDF